MPVRYEKEIPVADTNLQIMGVRTANIETLLNNLGMKSYLELIAFNPEFYLRLPFDKNVTSKLLDKIMKIASKYFSRRLDDEDLTDKEHFNDYELLYLCRKKYKKEKAYISEASKKVEIVDEIIKTN